MDNRQEGIDYVNTQQRDHQFESLSLSSKRKYETESYNDEDRNSSSSPSTKKMKMKELLTSKHIPSELQAIVDAAEALPELIDANHLRKTVLQFNKSFKNNQEMRMKYPDDPLKFMDSEENLHEQLKLMMVISSTPELYSEFIKFGALDDLITLLSHENMDIVLSTIDLLNEFTDEDSVSEITKKDDEGMKLLVVELCSKEVPGILIGALHSNFDETKPEEKQGILENLISIDPNLSEDLVEKTTLLDWLLNRIKPKGFDSNRQYAGELLAILLQNSRKNRLKLLELSGMDFLLKAVSYYKRRDPQELDEIEMMENLFDVLCSCLHENEGKKLFVEAEGIELMLMMIREKKMSRISSIRLLSSALTGKEYEAVVFRFIESGGLKALFPIFMRKGLKKFKKEYKDFSEIQDEGLLKATIDRPEYRIRVVAKFCENDFEKMDNLMLIRKQLCKKIEYAQIQIDEEIREFEMGNVDLNDQEIKTHFYLKRLDAGLFILQLVDQLVLFLYSDQTTSDLKEFIVEILKKYNFDVSELKTTVQEYSSYLDDDATAETELMAKLLLA